MSNSGKWFRVRVTDLKSGKSKTNVRIPLGMVDFGLKMGAKFAPDELEGIDLREIQRAIESNESGMLVDVEDEEKGEHVQVFVK